MIHIDQLYKKFGKNKVLEGVSLDLDKPGITAIMGPNGSGKTTLIKCILGLVLYDKGRIEFDQKDIRKKHNYRKHISHLPQIARFPDNLTAREVIRMIKDLRAGETKEQFFIDLFDLEKELDKKMGNLSGGNMQKVNLLLALMYDCPVLILDEPSTGLDPIALINLKEYLHKEKERGKIIIITTHILSFVEDMADHIIFLLDGNIYFNGSKQDLLDRHHEKKIEKTIAKIMQEQKETVS